MSKEELEQKLRIALAKANKPQSEIDKVIPFLLDLKMLQTDENRLIFFKQWDGKI